MGKTIQSRIKRWTLFVLLATQALLLGNGSALAADPPDWESLVRARIRVQDFSAASEIVNERLRQEPNDLEAHGWRARLLAWRGRWAEAESEYKSVLAQAPQDVDIILGLSDVLLWEGKPAESSLVLERAERLEAQNSEVVTRRARLAELSRKQTVDNHAASAAPQAKPVPIQEESASARRQYSLSIGSESDMFNYTTSAQAQSAAFAVQWDPRWSSTFSAMSYRWLGSDAAELSVAVARRLNKENSLSFSFGQGSHQPIAPLHQIALDYDRGLKLHIGLLRGLEFTPHSASIWFEASQVKVLGGLLVAYLPRDWMFTANLVEARTHFDGVGASWSPAATAKISLPVGSRLRVGVGYGSGAENYSNIDQIGRISARTFLGEGRFRLNHLQDFSIFVAHQQRSHGQTETSIGGGYVFRF